MLTGTYNVAFGTGTSLAATETTHYVHTTQAARVRSLGVVLSGTTINTVSPVVIEFAIVGGVSIGSITLSNGAVAGTAATATINPPIAVPANSVISATVSNAATVAGGTGTFTLGLLTG